MSFNNPPGPWNDVPTIPPLRGPGRDSTDDFKLMLCDLLITGKSKNYALLYVLNQLVWLTFEVNTIRK